MSDDAMPAASRPQQLLFKQHFHAAHSKARPQKAVEAPCGAQFCCVIRQQRGNNSPERPPEYLTEPHWAADILLWLELVVEDIQREGRTLKFR